MYEQLKDWGNDILRACIIIVVLFFLFWPVRLEGSSMDTTLNDGDIICMSRFLAQTGNIDRGDMVVFPYYNDGKKKMVLKRVIAIGGDNIYIDENGNVELNGEIIDEPYVTGTSNGIVDMKVPEGTVFVMGDNRTESFDSRQFGVISTDNIDGKVLVKIFPFGEWEWLG